MNTTSKSWETMEDEDTMRDLYLCFSLENRFYAFEVRYLTEILALPAITTIPGTAPFLKGVINIRGKIIPVMDVRLRFDMEFQPYHERTCVLLVELDGHPLGLIVDKVNDVVKIPAENVDLAPKIGESKSSRFIYGTGRVGDTVKILINLQRLLTPEESYMIQDIPGN
ncbi:MAG: purine-binding chemotaxis protein CheW [Leptospira sp.]|uniref:Chemotaxis protein CheW n=1 Tax=Leptospira paudalimensis TaxID=2950024 RepID=A0ABT3M900_9LEPT|nr:MULTISPECIES: chemotaxis protein CheW [Leptospira]MBL0955343.1 purine-binding chemotaxis protein CheW [Leptospira sp.]MCW7504854.1 chemotaxis protein CheW [Leptospira paudalimensis]